MNNAIKIKLPNKLHFYSDSRHGWLAVKRKLLHDLGIANQITVFSYQRGDTVYLEEDCDATLFYKTLKSLGFTWDEIEVRIKESYKDHSPIRSFADYEYTELPIY